MSEARQALEQRWLELTRTLLPGIARERGWPVNLDHCFQRILLDHACGSCWYEAIAGRPAYRKASDEQLAAAVDAGEQVLSGTLDLKRLNRESLRHRGKRGR
ncbi:GCN5-related N-acetyltransferase [Sphingomonas ginkgonis]|uniref:GCN5-related N-acetyltransferase n=1 Tax=Sphingomonas ginkgonis TaxID=2315330 RepID=UPI001C8C1482|nr:GCN5-related N-acetyltransferase [Sphingomonas ginkgonis]